MKYCNFTSREVLLLCLLLIGVVLPVAPASAHVQICGMTGLTMDECSSTNSKVRGYLQVGRLFEDHERWGFFHIGLLPVLVADNVKMEMPTAECLCNALADLQSPAEPNKPVSPFEMRHVEIKISDEKPRLVRADDARFETGGSLRLSGVSVQNGGGIPLKIGQATLLASGHDAGCLCWIADGRQKTFYLFSPSTEKIP